MNICGRYVNRMIFGLPMNLFLQFVVPLLAIPGLMLFKYGKPRGYLLDLILWHIKPQIYSGHEGDDEQYREYLIQEATQ
jgi:hypothetical protein